MSISEILAIVTIPHYKIAEKYPVKKEAILKLLVAILSVNIRLESSIITCVTY